MSQASPAGAIKVLVIDDSNTIRRSAELFLRQAGYEVILAEDGFDALSKISDHQPQVIFVDIMMPRLDGYQTCALIKQNPQLKSTPVIMLSSKDGVFDRARGRLAGSDRYLTKPFTKEALIEAAWHAQAIEQSNLTVQIAAVRRIFAERFGEGKVTGGEELTSVATGLALRAREQWPHRCRYWHR